MKERRIRQVNVLELDQAMYISTYQVGLEMANWLNASMHICMLETQEKKEFVSSVFGDGEMNSQFINKNEIEGIINDVVVKGELVNFGYSLNHFEENDSIKNIFGQLTLDESFSILGYNKSIKHKQVLKKLLKEELGNPLMLVPMDKELKNFHRLVIPFEPEYVTKKKLIQLKWYADQFGVMVDFVHFQKPTDSFDKEQLKDIYNMIYAWVDELKFSSTVSFRFPNAKNLNEGLVDYLKDLENYIVCVIDNEIKKSISTSISNRACLMDIKEPVVII